MGHIRDLPAKGLGVDVEHDFKPTYEILASRKKIVAGLRKKAADAERVYLAPDLDREGEAIAWHVKETLKVPEAKAFRVTFNEITKAAIEKAFRSPGKIAMPKVNAQQARRILDRLVGYEISPILWKKIPRTSGRNLSAGRVQSVAVRLIVEREREIEEFKPEEFWKIIAKLASEGVEFEAELQTRSGEKIAVTSEVGAKEVLAALDGVPFVVASVETRETKSNPAPPFTTSTLQQAASNLLRFPAKKTMRLAQDLYEGMDLGPDGPVALITYMRTDSVRIGTEAIGAIRSLILDAYGRQYLPDKARAYASRGKTQEAHEAVRPTYVERLPETVKPYLDNDHYRLYELIWKRTVASQMASAVFNVTTANIAAGTYGFVAKGRVVIFPGHTVLSNSDPNGEGMLPKLAAGQALTLVAIEPSQKFTQPPPRYTEASLIKTLEKEGIGRPSTYATIISTIQERGYVLQRSRQFYPTSLGVFVNDKLVRHFPTILDMRFTRRMEEELDEVESGETDWVRLLKEFYKAFEKSLKTARTEMTPFEETNEICPECGKGLVKRLSKAGLFLGCSGYPDCKYTRNLSTTGAAMEETKEQDCPVCGKPLAVRSGPKGAFLGCTGYPDCKYTAPVGTAQLPEVPEKMCPKCGKPLKVRSGKRGVFLGCSDYPKCRHTEPLPAEGSAEGTDGGATGGEDSGRTAGEGTAAPLPDVPEKACPECGKPMKVRRGKRGVFLGCSGYPKCRHTEALPVEGEEQGAGTGGAQAEKTEAPEARAAAEEALPEVPEKMCPECGKPLKVRSGKRGVFLGCSGYPTCKHTESLAGAGAAEAGSEGQTEAKDGATKASAKAAKAVAVEKKCPNCGKTLVVKYSRRGPFLACPGYPECKHAEPISGVPAKKPALKKVGRQCPDCGKDLVLRSGRRGSFIGCAGYPNCRYTEDGPA